MSYVRFRENGSDVYVYEHVGGFLECCACRFLRDDSPEGGPYGSFAAYSAAQMIGHLNRHVSAGHGVPVYVLERLEEEAVEIDAQLGEAA